MKDVISLLRPQQWLKNGFVLIGLIFSHGWSEPDLVRQVALGFVAFCLASSAVYVLNDYFDREADARHPTKRHRAIASGAVSLPAARMLMLGLFGGALGLPAIGGHWGVLLAVVSYLILNMAYTLHLKHKVLVDVFCIVAGFMIRLACGTYAVGIIPSRWMLLCSFMLTLFLGFAKRRAEIVSMPDTELALEGGTRIVLRHYSAQLLDNLVAITASATLLAYGLYTVDAETAAMHGTQHLVVTLPIVTFGVFRYLYLLYKGGSGEEPGRDLLADNQIRMAVLAWLVVVVLLVRT
ncbi:decaprenyl-phosphate phosphoribosyltransferase [Achromobacter seleniivolatilans]|uniref:Decaprenyl-phosphate phosphoribosyltransferase n=1 Tax=Achromobacter seleniivolatilans TaxID=3047478 RepID=A0ABY9LYA0_9BURK|nr:decaprenyl-phosphate phosphoribosyltransferase [Achromobacter sp. R39]WMD19764.1 decaprenyl-phosphate phosphoribosyltransferase [Achromobacter sp. R39]